MARQNDPFSQNIDWLTLLLYLCLVTLGWLNVYAAVYTPESHTSPFDMSTNAGKQLMWIGTTVILIICILVVNHTFFDTFAFVFYGFMILMLILVLVAGSNINGSRSWFKFGSFQIQPAEFTKVATALALAKYLDVPGINLSKQKDLLYVAGIIILPCLLIIASNETGSTLVFASFAIMLYREGLPSWMPAVGLSAVALFILALIFPKLYIFIGIGVLAVLVILLMPRYNRTVANLLAIGVVGIGMIIFVTGVDFFVNNVLQKHQRNRIKVLVDPTIDPLGVGWNVTQAKIAIGSGRLQGKGFLEGTQTKFDFVPEQSTDFIFCTIGEEHGFIGALVVISLFVALLTRLVILAEKQRTKFARVYGYCVAGIIFFHVMVNIGMTIGLMPVIGIPLPFFSYGGSSLWSFSILLFIFLKLDSRRVAFTRR
ncbi:MULTISPECIES: rod shape-determining protein RodA [unclassified Spirosoma]|uniref:rod shape-determining protein RodA n=1 Tax=unclassified Spirosoma TaxID=2621999 RepID=UPI00095D9B6C|nr:MULTISPECIES: rod shape-determining protein RodA [unclassified Spirosoma]MBN8821985.1 rod shape-determining protein RodA [Spirosoma sp.]OJW80399.1 MAG: rod shape-determining protein RodA [Spirosoma sp. 48-14]